MKSLVDRWKRRAWQPRPELAELKGTRPALIVTGGSEGIGLALARTFATPEHATILVARNPDRLEQAREEIIETGVETNDVLPLPLDITREDAAATDH